MEVTVEGQPRSKIGMDVFLSQHRGFVGKIKVIPEDFSVTEIDLSGKLVRRLEQEEETGLSKNFVFPAPSLLDEEKNVRTEVKGKSSGDNFYDGVAEEPRTSPPEGDQIAFDELTDLEKLEPILRDIIGVQVVDNLRTFSEQELSRNGLSSNKAPAELNASNGVQNTKSKDGNSPTEKCFRLCVIPEKEKRAFIHKSVQCLYPHLKTSTSKTLDDSSPSIQVSANPQYWDFRKHLTDHQAGKIIRFASSEFSTRTVSIEVDDACSKERRTAIHRMISKHFGKFLETKTCATAAGKQEIVVRFRERYARKDQRGVKRKVSAVEQEGCCSTYTGFTLKKQNLETLDALQQLGRALRVQLTDFSYAGVKDKKAVTLQSVAVKGISLERFKKMIDSAELPCITIGNIRPLVNPIHVGDLTGNFFDILIRDVHLGDRGSSQRDAVEGALLWQEIDNCVRCVKERGFVNYFGEQRFGLSCDGESQSAAIGQSILVGKYQQAVYQILAPDGDKDDPVNRAKRHFLQTQNPKEALNLMPRYKSRECLILKALHQHGLDREGCLRALHHIPHAMRQFYVHAFCSLIWNHMASQRLRLYGYKVVTGDLVLVAYEKRVTRDKIQEVSEADVQANTFSIRDIVLPLPGNSIRYPSSRVGEAYTKYLEETGLGSCAYRITELQLNIPGDYRRLIGWPRDLQWDLEQLHDEAVMTDAGGKAGADCSQCQQENRQGSDDGAAKSTVLEGVCKDGKSSSGTDAKYQCCSDNSQMIDHFPGRTETCNLGLGARESESKSMTNLRVKFTLPSSTYATVFLRELMKK